MIKKDLAVSNSRANMIACCSASIPGLQKFQRSPISTLVPKPSVGLLIPEDDDCADPSWRLC